MLTLSQATSSVTFELVITLAPYVSGWKNQPPIGMPFLPESVKSPS